MNLISSPLPKPFAAFDRETPRRVFPLFSLSVAPLVCQAGTASDHPGGAHETACNDDVVDVFSKVNYLRVYMRHACCSAVCYL